MGRAVGMAAHWFNNPKTSNIGYVEEHFCLDIRDAAEEEDRSQERD